MFPFPQLARFYFLSWRIFTSSVGAISLPQLAEMMVDGVVGVVRKALEPTAGDQLVNTSPDLTSRGMLTVIVGTIFEYIAGLAVESLTDGFEGGEAYGFGLARLEYLCWRE